MAEQKARHVIPKKHLYRAAFNWETLSTPWSTADSLASAPT